MRSQGLKSTYLSDRTTLIKCYKLSANNKPCFCIGAVLIKLLCLTKLTNFRKLKKN
jgi:hypothetical protein